MGREAAKCKKGWLKMKITLITMVVLAMLSWNVYTEEVYAETGEEEITSGMNVELWDQSELEKALAEGIVEFEPSDADFSKESALRRALSICHLIYVS